METKEGAESATMLSQCNIAQLPADVTMTLEAAPESSSACLTRPVTNMLRSRVCPGPSKFFACGQTVGNLHGLLLDALLAGARRPWAIWFP